MTHPHFHHHSGYSHTHTCAMGPSRPSRSPATLLATQGGFITHKRCNFSFHGGQWGVVAGCVARSSTLPWMYTWNALGRAPLTRVASRAVGACAAGLTRACVPLLCRGPPFSLRPCPQDVAAQRLVSRVLGPLDSPPPSTHTRALYFFLMAALGACFARVLWCGRGAPRNGTF
jgi:hypothetical protein